MVGILSIGYFNVLVIGMGTMDRFICETGLSIAVNQSKPDLPLHGSVFYACTGFLEA